MKKPEETLSMMTETTVFSPLVLHKAACSDHLLIDHYVLPADKI